MQAYLLNHHNLMCRQCRSSYPTHINGTEAERCRFHTQLQRYRPPHAMQLPLVCLRNACLVKVFSIKVVMLRKVEHTCHQHQLQESAQQGGKSRSHQSHFWQSPMAKDEQPVAEYVEDVGDEHYPHRHRSILYAVAELLVGIENHHGQHAQQQHQQIRANQGQKLVWQSHPRKSKEKQPGKQRHQQTNPRTSKESVPKLAGNVMLPTLSQQSAHNRRQAVGEAHTTHNEQGNNVIHETSCSQFVRSIMSYHKRIGEPHHDEAHLPHHDWHADAQEVCVM